MTIRSRNSAIAFLLACAMLLAVVGPTVSNQATPAASPVAIPDVPAEPLDSTSSDVDLDVLFIGAHPDDEAFGLAAYGQWNAYAGVEVGVVTVTRGEGGGNAVGTEEGPALGLLREREERAAVRHAGISHVFNLDKVDFYYTVSAPLTIETWDYDDTLARVVRVIRATTPEVIITMNPSPTPGNHGHHQVAARLAVDAFYAAADGEAFPDPAFEPWTVGSIYQNGASGEGTPGPDCATTYAPAEETDTIFGVWQGTPFSADDDRTWGEVARDGQRTYASQGWAVFPDAPTDPNEIMCNYFTLIDTRVPISGDIESTTAMLQNAVLEEEGGLPLGTQFSLETDAFIVAPGDTLTVGINASLPSSGSLSDADIRIVPPEGWVAPESDSATPVESDAQLGSAGQVQLQVPADVVPGRYAISAEMDAEGGTGATREVVQVVAPVTGVLAPLPEIAQFQDWVVESGVEQLNNLIAPVTSIAVNESKTVDVVVTNNSTEAQSGTVELGLPEGFDVAESEVAYEDLEPGESTTVSFTVSNTDPSLATSNQGGEEGNYPVTITTESNSGNSEQTAGLNLVPSTVIPAAGDDIAVDGELADGEYTGDALDLSRVWEGDDPESASDASGSAHVAWTEDGIYIAVEVTDDTLGTVLSPEDAKRHWRTDSVEIAIDPLGTAPNTSATFKVGVFPTTTDDEPAAYRDADAHQGPVAETAPGFEVASTLTEPYTGYVLETFIPFSALPADIDPANAAMNIFIYDSDTEDLTGQTRLGWSTWNGVQGDPYRWGGISLGEQTLTGSPVAMATPVSDATPVASAELDEPIMPLDVALSSQSPLSIAQSASDGVPLAGMPPVAPGEGITITNPPTLADQQLSIAFEAAQEGTLQVYAVDAEGNVLADQETTLSSGETQLTLGEVVGEGQLTLLVSFVTADGEVQALSYPISM